MSYTAEISRANPTCFVFVIDQSGSMGDPFGGESAGRKADIVADVVNRTLHDLVIRCTKTEEIRNYYHVSIIGYGGQIKSGFTGALQGKGLVPISDIADNPARVENRGKRVPDGAGGLVEQQVKFPVWVDPTIGGTTPMCEALSQAASLVRQWTSEHPNSFPPTVLHLTDGESTDGNPTDIAGHITSSTTSDGPALLFTCHVSSSRGPKAEYPSDASQLGDQFAKVLFNLSSQLPTPFRNSAASVGVNTSEGARGFVFNGDAASVVQFFEIGTRPANER